MTRLSYHIWPPPATGKFHTREYLHKVLKICYYFQIPDFLFRMDIMLPENVMNRRLLFAHAPARSALGGSTGIRAKRWLGVAVIITVLGMGGTVPAAEAPAVTPPVTQDSTETVKSYSAVTVPLRVTTTQKYEKSGGRQIQVPRTLTFSLEKRI
jgi:hypothetical protein